MNSNKRRMYTFDPYFGDRYNDTGEDLREDAVTIREMIEVLETLDPDGTFVVRLSQTYDDLAAHFHPRNICEVLVDDNGEVIREDEAVEPRSIPERWWQI